MIRNKGEIIVLEMLDSENINKLFVLYCEVLFIRI